MLFSFATDTFPGLQNIRWSVNVGCKFSICGLCQCACIVAVRKSALQDTETNNIALSSVTSNHPHPPHRVGETIFNLKLAPSQISTIYHLSSVVECKQQHCLVPINTNTAGSRGLWWRLRKGKEDRGSLETDLELHYLVFVHMFSYEYCCCSCITFFLKTENILAALCLHFCVMVYRCHERHPFRGSTEPKKIKNIHEMYI